MTELINIDWQCSWQKIPELYMLEKFLLGYKIERVLEIGTHIGSTAALWAKMVEKYNGKVYCIDLDFSFRVYENMPQRKFITEFQGNSHDIDFKKRIFREVGIRTLDLLFIDGDHSYDGVKEDFYSYVPLVKPGGFVVLHDIMDTPHMRDDMNIFVGRFWNEIKVNYEHQEFIYPEYDVTTMQIIGPSVSLGIGVLRIPS